MTDDPNAYDPLREYPRSYGQVDRSESLSPVGAQPEQQTKDLRLIKSALEGWKDYAQENLSEFDIEPCEAEKLCPQCENSGCIWLKINETWGALRAIEDLELTAASQPPAAPVETEATSSDGERENRTPASHEPQASASRRSQDLIGVAGVASGPSDPRLSAEISGQEG